MNTPKLISTVVKTTSATTLTLAIAVTTTAKQPGIAQITQSTNLESSSHLIESVTQVFQPPRDQRRADGHRIATGTRQDSCVGDSKTAFTLLGPDEMVGQTVSSRPEFVWHLPPSVDSYTVQFRLLGQDEEGVPDLIHSKELDYTGGFMTYQLPPEVEALSPHIEEYRWQVVVICDANYPSRSLSQERFFEVVAPTASQQQTLEAAVTETDRAIAYGQAGFWYDAIAQVARSADPQPRAARQSLLEDLATVEAENEDLSERLLNIADIAD